MTLMGWWRRRCGPTQSSKETGHLYQLSAAFSAVLSVMVTGSCIGWVTPNLLLLLSPESPVPMTHSEASWMIALLELGNLITPIPAGFMADSFGRKPLILAAGPIYVLSWVLVYYAQTATFLYAARIIQGCGIGVVFTVVPMYLGEIPSPRFRGTVTSIFLNALVAGYLFECCVGPYVSYRTLLVVSGVVPVIFMVCFCFQPESPYYYLMKGDEKAAAKSLAHLRGKDRPEEVMEELSTLSESIGKEMADQTSWKDVIGTSTNRQALLIVNVVGAVKILGGSIAVPTYCTQFFSQTGFEAISPNALTIIMSVVVFLFGFISAAMSDILGRRPLLMVSCIGSALTLSSISAYFLFKDVLLWDVRSFSWVSPLALILYSLFMAFGLDPVSVTYRAEMFPSNTRSTAAIINSYVFTFSSFVTLKLYQVVSEDIGVFATYLGFAVVCFGGALWLYFNAVETKGKTLSEVQVEIQNSVQMRRKKIIIKGNNTSPSTIHM